MKLLNRRFLAILVLIALIILSLATNYSNYMRSQIYLTLYQQTILDPMGMEYYSPNEKPEIRDGKELVVFLGDSRALVWPAPNSDRFAFVNRGINGQTTAQVLGRFSDDIPVLQPDFVIIQVGVNDMTAIPILPNQKNRIIAHCKDNIQKLTEQTIALDATVILTTIFPIKRTLIPWQVSGSEQVASSVEEVNQFIHSLASERVIVMDTGEILANPDGYLNPEYSLDTLHLNIQGYRALNEALSEILENIPTSK